MGNAKEYQKLLEPPTKQEKVSNKKKTYVIYGQYAINWNIPRSVAIGI